MLLAATLAAAAPIALLALDGRGVDAEVAQDVTSALQDAMVADGRLDVMLAAPIADALGVDHEADLKKARERVAAGRKSYESSATPAAITALTEAIELHRVAGSAWVRRAELADAHWLLALCLLRDGKVLEGRAELEQVARLWPGYGRTRGSGSGVAARVLDEVEAGLARESWTIPSDEILDGLFRDLEPEWLAVGVVDAAGSVSVHLLERTGNGARVDGVVALPVDSLEFAYASIASAIAEVTGGVDEPPEDEPIEAALARSTDSTAAAPPDSGRPVTIRERGTIRYDDRPVTAKWWFWTSVVAVLGGTSAVAIVLAQPPTVVEVQNPDTYTISVATP